MLLTSHGNCEGSSSSRRNRTLCVSLPIISYLASKNCKYGLYFMFVDQITPSDDRHRFCWSLASTVYATCWPLGPSSHYVRLANDECRWLLFFLSCFFLVEHGPWSFLIGTMVPWLVCCIFVPKIGCSHIIWWQFSAVFFPTISGMVRMFDWCRLNWCICSNILYLRLDAFVFLLSLSSDFLGGHSIAYRRRRKNIDIFP